MRQIIKLLAVVTSLFLLVNKVVIQTNAKENIVIPIEIISNDAYGELPDDAIYQVHLELDQSISNTSSKLPYGDCELPVFEKEGKYFLELDPSQFEDVGDYYYKMTLQCDNPYVVVDEVEYKLKVSSNLKGNVKSFNVFVLDALTNAKQDKALFKNRYPKPFNAKNIFDLKLLITGEPYSDDDFEFVLTSLDSLKMPSVIEGKTRLTADNELVLKLKGSGKDSFGTLLIDKPGLYKFEVFQVDGGLRNYQYDLKKYDVILTVKTNESKTQLIGDYCIMFEDEEVEELLFINNYTRTILPSLPLPPNVYQGGGYENQILMPNTGDYLHLKTYFIMLLVSVMVYIFAAHNLND